MKKYCLVIIIIFNSMYGQNMIENLLIKQPELIKLSNVNYPIEYWKITEKDFNDINKLYDVNIIKELSDIKSGVYVYQIKDFVIVKESIFYSLFKNRKDVELINNNHETVNIYEPLEDFNFLGEDFLYKTDIKNDELKLLTGLNLNFSIDSLDDLDEYISSLEDEDKFLLENRLLLLSYLGNVIIKNNNTELVWTVTKINDENYWEPKLINSESEYEIEITKWFLSYIYEEENRIMGLRGLYSVLN